MSTVNANMTPEAAADAATRPAVQESQRQQAKIERWILLYLVGLVLVLTTLIARAIGGVAPDVAAIPAAIGAILLGAPLMWAAGRELLFEGKATYNALAALAILAAISLGEYVTAGLLAFILLIAEQVVRRTAWGAQRAIEQLVRLTPDTARVVRDGEEREVSLKEVREGDVIRVRPGENLPVDGTVSRGTTLINQASLTGESAPVEAQEGAQVFAGTTNLTGQIDLKATSVGADTTIGKVSQLIREAEHDRTPRQLLIEQVAAYFVPVALSVAGLVWYFMSKSESPVVRGDATLTAITILVVLCPSALLLSSPTAMVAAFAAAARLGIMIKQTGYLERSADIDTVVFDKTGTITTGVFAVSRLVPAEGVEGAALLQAAADGEVHSNHPLARSIMHTAKTAKITPAESDQFEEIHGRGVRAQTAGGEVLVGRRGWIAELIPGAAAEIEQVESKMAGMTGVHVAKGGRYLGAVGLEDKMRKESTGVVSRLRELGVTRVAMFTGDRRPVADRVGAAVGVDTIEAEMLPDEKHEKVKSLIAQDRRVLVVGDGINDGPSLAAADVGVAMGLSGSDIATNSAGVALMSDDLSRVPFLIDLARKSRGVITQNIVASIILALIGLALAATGTLSVLVAALYQMLGNVFVIGNSFRLIRYGEEYAEYESAPVVAAEQPKRSDSATPAAGAGPAAAGI
jgi:heavy metal translocating P-type ATPase